MKLLYVTIKREMRLKEKEETFGSKLILLILTFVPKLVSSCQFFSKAADTIVIFHSPHQHFSREPLSNRAKFGPQEESS